MPNGSNKATTSTYILSLHVSDYPPILSVFVFVFPPIYEISSIYIPSTDSDFSDKEMEKKKKR